MEYVLVISDKRVWEKDMKKIPADQLAIIRKKILALRRFPSGDVKKLKGASVADYRLRSGNFRILFDIDQKKGVVILHRILDRKDTYRF